MHNMQRFVLSLSTAMDNRYVSGDKYWWTLCLWNGLANKMRFSGRSICLQRERERGGGDLKVAFRTMLPSSKFQVANTRSLASLGYPAVQTHLMQNSVSHLWKQFYVYSLYLSLWNWCNVCVTDLFDKTYV